MGGLLHGEIDEHSYFSRRDAKTNQIHITQRRKAPPGPPIAIGVTQRRKGLASKNYEGRIQKSSVFFFHLHANTAKRRKIYRFVEYFIHGFNGQY